MRPAGRAPGKQTAELIARRLLQIAVYDKCGRIGAALRLPLRQRGPMDDVVQMVVGLGALFLHGVIAGFVGAVHGLVLCHGSV